MSKPKRKNKLLRSEGRAAYILLIPSIIGLIFLTYLPLVEVFGLSLFDWRGVGTPNFVGLANYIRLFTKDPYFVDSIKVTLFYSVLAVFGSIIYSFVIALLLNRKIPARGFFRALFYLPYVLPAMAVYLGWNWLYESNYGLFNYLLSLIGVNKVNFISSTSLVVPSLALIAIWLSGNLIVIFLAGLQNVPRVYQEAAEIDGANSWQRFWNITVPCMTPIIFYNLIMALVTNLQVVTPALALTNGGPGNSSRFISYVMYQYAFKDAKFSYACAISFVLFLLIAAFSSTLFMSSKSWVYSEGGND